MYAIGYFSTCILHVILDDLQKMLTPYNSTEGVWYFYSIVDYNKLSNRMNRLMLLISRLQIKKICKHFASGQYSQIFQKQSKILLAYEVLKRHVFFKW